MAKNYLINEETLKKIADAIRLKTGGEGTILVSHMDSEIQSIVTSDAVLKDLTVIPTGTQQIIEPEEGVNGFRLVTVQGDENLISENIKSGVSIYGVMGILEETPTIQLIDIELTDNGEWLAPEGFGFQKVIVKVSGGSGAGVKEITIKKVESEKTKTINADIIDISSIKTSKIEQDNSSMLTIKRKLSVKKITKIEEINNE